MFEDATIESSGRLTTRSRYYTLFGAALNGALLAAMILVPLLHPEALPRSANTAVLVAPPPPPALPPVRLHPVPRLAQLSLASEFTAPRRIPASIHTGVDRAQPPEAPLVADAIGAATAPWTGLSNLVGTYSAPSLVKVLPPERVAISQGVMAGNLISKAQPFYPAIARAARVQGTVVLSATISKTGTIENLAVVSGPAMLTQAAIDAVKLWRYRPYQLNNQPVEVQTTVNVAFTLGGG